MRALGQRWGQSWPSAGRAASLALFELAARSGPVGLEVVPSSAADAADVVWSAMVDDAAARGFRGRALTEARELRQRIVCSAASEAAAVVPGTGRGASAVEWWAAALLELEVREAATRPFRELWLTAGG